MDEISKEVLSVRVSSPCTFAGRWQKACNIEDGPEKPPVLCGSYEEESVPDIRQANKQVRNEGVLGESGAESFFCSEFECIKEKNEILKLCGMRNADDIIEKFVNDLADDYVSTYESIKRSKKSLEKQERFLEALALKLGYQSIGFTERGVKLQKGDMIHRYPLKDCDELDDDSEDLVLSRG